MFYIRPIDWYAISLNLPEKSAWLDWNGCLESTDKDVDLPQTKHIPMLQARRMSNACKLACEVMLNLLNNATNTIDAAVFVSQHGELARSTKIIQAIINNQPVSPTDFSMSVHNTASGLATILSKNTMEISSISAGTDGFQQGLFEAQSFFAQGAKNVILLDFDDRVPDIYQTGDIYNIAPYACGFILSNEKEYHCVSQKTKEPSSSLKTPQSLQFLNNYLKQQSSFSVNSLNSSWLWTRQ